MATAIDTIYDWLSGLTISPSTDHVVSVRDRDVLRDEVQMDELPLRMLIIPDEAMRGEMAFVALGTLITINWTIVDRLFWRVAGQGRGLQDYSDHIIQYIKSYVTNIQADRSPTSQSDVTSISFIPRYVEWPAGSGIVFICVDAILTIQEVCA